MASRRKAAASARPLHVAIAAGEHSGDLLAADLMAALRKAHKGQVRFTGVGGPAMTRQGLKSLIPYSELALFGFGEVLMRLPRLLRLVRDAAFEIAQGAPDVLVIVDSPELTHAIAKRVRRARPDIPVVNYVPPTVWAWRPWRARRMRRYVDLSLALLPFEPDAHKRLGGPPCVYVGHPLTAKLKDLRGQGRKTGKPVLVVLPGSRASEVRRLMPPFGTAVARLKRDIPDLEVVLPAVRSVSREINARLRDWPVRPRVVSGDKEKHAAFRAGTAALAASGTVSLELALARLPMVVAYRLERIATVIRYLVISRSVVMANLVLGRNAVPEFLQEKCTPDNLVRALRPLLHGGPERAAQLAAFGEIEQRMRTGTREGPSALAAREVLRLAGTR